MKLVSEDLDPKRPAMTKARSSIVGIKDVGAVWL